MKLGQEAGRAHLLNAGLLDPRLLLAGVSARALLHPQKGIAIAQQKLIDARLMASKRGDSGRGGAGAEGAGAFGHQRQDVQEAALALIGKHPGNFGSPMAAPLAELRLRHLTCPQPRAQGRRARAFARGSARRRGRRRHLLR